MASRLRSIDGVSTAGGDFGGTLKGRIDGSLINGRGIDALWVKASKTAAPGARMSGFFEARIVEG